MIPLQGTRVLDLTMTDGFCTMEMADYGAEVIKIEAPGKGDPVRSRPPLKNGASAHHAFRNRGKKSVTLDIATERGREIFKQLVATADVVVENFMPGTMESLGLGYETLSAINPALVYARLTAYGSSGPESDTPMSDIVAQAKSGVMHLTGFPENAPTRIGFAITEHFSATFLSIAINVALYHARATGEGQIVETSLIGSVISITEDKILTYGATGEDPMRTGNAHPLINPYDIIKCKDGYVAMGISSDDQWVKFCDAFGRPEWKDDPKYNSNQVRGLNYFGDLRDKIEGLLAGFTMQEVTDTCDSVLIPGTMCATTAEAVQSPQLKARNMLVTVPDKELGDLVMAGRPVKFADQTEEPLRSAPLLGEHNAEIFGALDLGRDDQNRLRRDGVI